MRTNSVIAADRRGAASCLPRHPLLTLPEKVAYGRIAFEADRDVVGASRFVMHAGLREQFRERGPVRLVFRESPIAGERAQDIEARWRAALRGDREGA